MGIRRGNQPDSIPLATDPYIPDRRSSAALLARPRARDPPGGHCHSQFVRPASSPRERRRGDVGAPPLLTAGLAKLVLVTASYVTW
jgi:hypothetical protein